MLTLVGSYFENQHWWFDDIVNFINKNNLDRYIKLLDFTLAIDKYYNQIHSYPIAFEIPLKLH
jgi:hypothetical protein